MRKNWLSGDTRKIDTSFAFLSNIIKQELNVSNNKNDHIFNNNETLSDMLVSF